MSRFRFRPLALLLTAIFLAGGCATTPSVWTEPAPMEAAERRAHNLRIYDRAADRVESRFYDVNLRGVDWSAARARYRETAAAATDDEALYAAINTLIGELRESHTAALAPRHVHEMRARQRTGTGFRMRRLEGHWVVSEVMPGTPAEAAGVLPGWIVESRDGERLGEDLRLVNLPGQAITYGFIDGVEQTRRLTMTAGPVSVEPRLESRMLEGGVVLLRFDDFSHPTLRWLSRTLNAHQEAPALVVDLRNNPGGLLYSLSFAVGEFFPRRVELGTFIWRNGREKDANSYQWGSARYAGKVVVLIDGGSASSAEIFAHVLRHHGRAVLVGRKTAGAVIASRDYRLPSGGRLQVAVSDYLGLDGRRLEGEGVAPDIEVLLTLNDLRRGHDADLAAALEFLHQSPTAIK